MEEENPFINKEKLANFELQQKKRNTRRQVVMNATVKLLNANDKAREANRALRMSSQANVSQLQKNANNAMTAKQEAETALRHLEDKHLQEEENRSAQFIQNLPKMMKNMENRSAKTNVFLRNFHTKMANYNRRQEEDLRAMPKNDAVNYINRLIASYRNVLNRTIKEKRNSRKNIRKYTEKMSNEEQMGILASYDPTLDPNSPEAKAMNTVIQEQLKYKKNIRAGTRKLLNKDNANTERNIKQSTNHMSKSIKRLEALKKEIQRKK